MQRLISGCLTDAVAIELTGHCIRLISVCFQQLLKILAKEGKLVQLYEQAKERSEKLNQARKKQKTK